MSPARRYLRQRHENEPAPEKLRMWQEKLSLQAPKAGTADNPTTEVENIEIERPRLPMAALSPTCVAFEAFEQPQEHGRAGGSPHSDNHVQVDWLSAAAKRFCAIGRRLCKNVETRVSELHNRST